MTGGLLQHARKMAAEIATTGGFTVSAVLKTPNESTSLNVTGLATGTWMSFDDLNSGKIVNSTSNSFNIPVSQLDAAEYPYLVNGRPNLLKHKIIVSDGAGMSGTFTITEQHPNATLGMMVCILGRN